MSNRTVSHLEQACGYFQDPLYLQEVVERLQTLLGDMYAARNPLLDEIDQAMRTADPDELLDRMVAIRPTLSRLGVTDDLIARYPPAAGDTPLDNRSAAIHAVVALLTDARADSAILASHLRNRMGAAGVFGSAARDVLSSSYDLVVSKHDERYAEFWRRWLAERGLSLDGVLGHIRRTYTKAEQVEPRVGVGVYGSLGFRHAVENWFRGTPSEASDRRSDTLPTPNPIERQIDVDSDGPEAASECNTPAQNETFSPKGLAGRSAETEQAAVVTTPSVCPHPCAPDDPARITGTGGTPPTGQQTTTLVQPAGGKQVDPPRVESTAGTGTGPPPAGDQHDPLSIHERPTAPSPSDEGKVSETVCQPNEPAGGKEGGRPPTPRTASKFAPIPPPPFFPLTSWAEIFDVLNTDHPGRPWKNDERTRGKLRTLNQQFEGPIQLPVGRGKQPKVGKAALQKWWLRVAEQHDSLTEAREEAEASEQASAAGIHAYGRSGTVVPEINGSVGGPNPGGVGKV